MKSLGISYNFGLNRIGKVCYTHNMKERITMKLKNRLFAAFFIIIPLLAHTDFGGND